MQETGVTNPVLIHDLSSLSESERDLLLRRTEDDLSFFLEKVDPIINAVQHEGDDALARFAREYDKADVSVDSLAATEKDFALAFDALDPEFIEVLEYAADNIKRYHQAQMPQELWMKEIRPGVLVGERTMAIDSVACYSPRGKGCFPSVTLMTAIPAVVAGVARPVILTPPTPDGAVDPATLVAARLAGVDEVYKAGGAQAVAAAAFGTKTIPACRKFEGPGSPWVAAAKQRLAGRIDPGLPAGPSEVIVLADPTANPAIAALDLIIEAEHGSDGSAFLVTWSRELAEQAHATIPTYLSEISEQRRRYAVDVLSSDSGGIVLATSAEEAYTFVNDYAPEHLQILSKSPHDHLAHIRNAAEILLGENLPGCIANYMMGPNCVLPTSGAAHTRSPLGVRDFLKSSSIGHMTRGGYDEMAPLTHRFASYEGFDAHANAVSSLRDAAFESIKSSV